VYHVKKCTVGLCDGCLVGAWEATHVTTSCDLLKQFVTI
jgi:hypothetical protein